MYTSVDFTSQIAGQRGPLSYKQGGLIHQVGVWLGRDLKNRLLLLLLLLLSQACSGVLLITDFLQV
jgi:hypothetical protein